MGKNLRSRWISGLLLTGIFLLLCACGQSTEAQWQEQYDLGVRYLSEGNYEEAIIAFTAAIEIDPKRPEGYTGRGDAYALSGDTEDHLAAALTDYEAALALDGTLADAWLGLVDVYIRQGDYDKALEILREALEKTGNDTSIADKIAEMEGGSFSDSAGNIRRANTYELNGTLTRYTEYEYDDLGRQCGWYNYSRYDSNGNLLDTFHLENYCEVILDEEGKPEQNRFYSADDILTYKDSFVYNNEGLKSQQYRYLADGTLDSYFYFYYNDQGQEIRYEGYWADGTMYAYWLSEYDETGKWLGETMYDAVTNEVIEYSAEG